MGTMTISAKTIASSAVGLGVDHLAVADHAGSARTIDHREWLRETFLRGFGKCIGQHVSCHRRRPQALISTGRWGMIANASARCQRCGEQLATTPIDGGCMFVSSSLIGIFIATRRVATGSGGSSIAGREQARRQNWSAFGFADVDAE